MALSLVVACRHTVRAHGGDSDERIRAVEVGLGDAFRLKGAAYPTRTIAAEMERLAIPGASVAVVHDGAPFGEL